MNGLDFINENLSKKMGIAIVGMITLVQAGAETWQIMALAIIAVIIQGIIDLRKPNIKEKQDV